jgi:TPR repeat protein
LGILKGIEYLKKAKEYEKIGDIYYFGKYGVKKNYQNAFVNYEKCNCYNKLGDFYRNGFYKTKNYSEAFKYYNLSIKKYHKTMVEFQESNFELGQMYFLGDYVKKDYKKAYEYFIISSNVNKDIDHFLNNNYTKSFSLFYLGYMNRYGLGRLIDYNEAFTHFSQSTIIGESNYELGLMYIFGIGVEKDYKIASKYIKKAFDEDIDEAKKVWNEFELWKFK